MSDRAVMRIHAGRNEFLSLTRELDRSRWTGSVPYSSALQDEKRFFEDSVAKLGVDRIDVAARQQAALAQSRRTQGLVLQGLGWGGMALGGVAPFVLGLQWLQHASPIVQITYGVAFAGCWGATQWGESHCKAGQAAARLSQQLDEWISYLGPGAERLPLRQVRERAANTIGFPVRQQTVPYVGRMQRENQQFRDWLTTAPSLTAKELDAYAERQTRRNQRVGAAVGLSGLGLLLSSFAMSGTLRIGAAATGIAGMCASRLFLKRAKVALENSQRLADTAIFLHWRERDRNPAEQ